MSANRYTYLLNINKWNYGKCHWIRDIIRHVYFLGNEGVNIY